MDHGQQASGPAKLGPKSKHQPRPKAKAKSQIQDDSIMGTNNSSITSKRSVERLYFPNEAHFFRYFVKKPQRRAPLINRGYWLRMKAIDHVVRQFLEAPSSKPKVVINLGCGYDPLPWQCITRFPNACNNAKFIDIDYKDLMLRKRDMVQKTPELNCMFTSLNLPSTGDIVLQSDQYIQLGCDLRELQKLDQLLRNAVNINDCQLMFTAEVSITYMNVEAADALVQWTSSLPDAQFCLLEQLLPDGIGHPFAETMMTHFNKLSTPLGSVQRYPTLLDQEERFKRLGWSNAYAQNLWELWSSPDFMTPLERLELDHVEPFDEWEEFALFGCHYILLIANNSGQPINGGSKQVEHSVSSVSLTPLPITTHFKEYPKMHGRRRFASAFRLKGPEKDTQNIGNFAGMGLSTRQGNFDVYSKYKTEMAPPNLYDIQHGPSSRMCHTMTDLGDDSVLLVGGRTSPDTAMNDCWVYHKWLNTWERVDDLPDPRYRHSAVSLGSGIVLISTARKDSRTILDDYLIWSRCHGWVRCERKSNDGPCATFGVTFARFPWQEERYSGFIAGGIDAHGAMPQDVWTWVVEEPSSKTPYISFSPLISPESPDPTLARSLARFGASTTLHNGKIVVVGGIMKDYLLTAENEICVLNPNLEVQDLKPDYSGSTPRPLLVGVSTISCDKKLHIMGGSAVCFSFGTFWNDGSYSLDLDTHQQNITNGALKLSDIDVASHNRESHGSRAWQYLHTVERKQISNVSVSTSQSSESGSPVIVNIPRKHVDSVAGFSQILAEGKPVILEGQSIGSCTTKWTSSYLKEHIGKDKEVVVHEASEEQMNFAFRNFTYTTQRFGEFIDKIDAGARLYLRSLSTQKPSELPANIATDFPEIAQDFQLPAELAFVAENVHSSPLRISGPVAMWLHYDVMANVLCQIRGSKRLILFPPTDVNQLEFEAGASSSGINVFEKIGDSSMGRTHPHEALLQPGDILFLPSFWLHTASPTSGLSIAINMFFRDLQSGYAAGKDVYGNRDLQVYEKGRQDISKIVRSFEALPTDIRGFYLQRLANELQQKTV